MHPPIAAVCDLGEIGGVRTNATYAHTFCQHRLQCQHILRDTAKR